MTVNDGLGLRSIVGMGLSQSSLFSPETGGLEALLLASAGPSDIALVEATRGALVEDVGGVMPLDADDVDWETLALSGSVYIHLN